MMPSPVHLLAVLAIGFAITFALRAVPFAILAPLRESRLVAALARWMPAGILAILAAATFLPTAGVTAGAGGFTVDQALLWKGAVAAVVTVIAHLLSGRRTLVSVGLGTLTFVVLVNLAS